MNFSKTCTALLLFAAFSSCESGGVYAQNTSDTSLQSVAQSVTTMKPGESQFMVAGLMTFGFVNQKTTNSLGGVKSSDKSNSLGDADRYEFSPMLLWRHGDKLLLEFEPSFDGNGLGVNWADVSYFVSPGFIVRGGYLVLPFGTYNKRLAAGWINKLTSDPVGMDMAGTDFGVEVEGGLPLGSMKWSYDISLSNGLQLNNDGTTTGVGINAINNGKTVCGRVSLLPLSNSSLEIGLSALSGALATPQGATFSNTNPSSTAGPTVNMYAVDLNFIKNINPMQINVKGQYNTQMISDQNYVNPSDSSTYTFKNNTSVYFGQISLRPAQSKNNILKNLELAFRYVNYTTPKQSLWGQNYNEYDVALDYWLSWRTVLKVGYEGIKTDGTTSQTESSGLDGTSTTINRLIIQFSTEF